MVKKLLSNFTLLIGFMLMGISNVWGSTKTDTYTFTSKDWEATPTNWTKGKGSGGFTNNQGVQVTSNSSSTGANATSPIAYENVTKVVVTYNTNKSAGVGEIVIKVGNNTEKKNSVSHPGGNVDGRSANFTSEFTYQAPESGNVKITVNTTTNSIYIKSIAITYEENDLANAEFSFGDVTSFTANINGDFEAPTLTTAEGYDGTITYSSSDEDIAVVDESTGEVVIGEKVGTVTITASAEATDNFKAGEASYTIKVIDPNANDGLSEEKAFTVAEAIAAISNGDYDASTTYFVKGIISQIDSYNATYGSITYWISDDGSTTTQFECYSGLNIGGEQFESVEDLSTGDQVVVKGTMKKYNDVYEFNYNNEIVSRIADQRIDIATINSISIETVALGESGTINYDIDFADGTAEDDYEVTLSSSDDNLLLLDGFTYVAGDEEGSVTITVSVEPVDDASYKAVSKTFTVTVYDANKKGSENNPYTVADLIAMNGTAATSENVYVKGWTVGYLASSTNLITDDPTQFAITNVALADDPSESNIDNVVAASFQNNSARAALNLKDNPWNAGVAQVLLYGKLAKSFGKVGLQSVLVNSKKVAEQVNISNAGMATYYTDCALDFAEFTDMYAYTATVSGSTITFSRVMQVPANTGVLLRNPAEDEASNVVPVATGTVGPVEGNKFVGTLTDITVSDAGCYILNNGSNGLGFYKVKSTGSKVAAHRAYLKTGTDGVRSFIGFSEGDANGIESIGAEAAQSMEVYNLQGVRVAQPTKGLYIMNGKKVIFK